jgi:Na+-driven multidrug efflux pump
MAVAFAACTACLGLAVAEDWGVRGVWAALAALILVRAATMGARFTRRRWLVTGWA